jgi:hypothetical protein
MYVKVEQKIKSLFNFFLSTLNKLVWAVSKLGGLHGEVGRLNRCLGSEVACGYVRIWAITKVKRWVQVNYPIWKSIILWRRK